MARNELMPKEEYFKEVISTRLKRLIDANGVTQAQLAERLKIPKSTLNGYFLGASLPNAGNIQKMADYFGVNKSDIDPRFDVPENAIEIQSVHTIPVIGRIACGNPIIADENVIDKISFPIELMPNGKIFFLQAQGDSMEPLIKEDAYVMIRQQETIENGEIGAVLFEDSTEATLKKVKFIGDSILLESINDDYEPIIVNKENRPRIIGKAVKVLNDL